MQWKRYGPFVWKTLHLRRFCFLLYLGSWKSINRGLLYELFLYNFLFLFSYPFLFDSDWRTHLNFSCTTLWSKQVGFLFSAFLIFSFNGVCKWKPEDNKCCDWLCTFCSCSKLAFLKIKFKYWSQTISWCLIGRVGEWQKKMFIFSHSLSRLAVPCIGHFCGIIDSLEDSVCESLLIAYANLQKKALVQHMYLGRNPPLITEMRVLRQSSGDDHLVWSHSCACIFSILWAAIFMLYFLYG